MGVTHVECHKSHTWIFSRDLRKSTNYTHSSLSRVIVVTFVLLKPICSLPHRKQLCLWSISFFSLFFFLMLQRMSQRALEQRRSLIGPVKYRQLNTEQVMSGFLPNPPLRFHVKHFATVWKSVVSSFRQSYTHTSPKGRVALIGLSLFCPFELSGEVVIFWGFIQCKIITSL